MDFYQKFFLGNLIFTVIGFLVPLCFYQKLNGGKNIAVLSGVSASLCGLIGAGAVLINNEIFSYSGWIIISILNIGVKIDNLAAFFLLIVNFLSLINFIFSQGYLKGQNYKNVVMLSLLNLFSLSLSGVILADNSLLFLLFWEMMALISFVLIMFEHQSTNAKLNSYIYLVITHLGTAFITCAFLLLYLKTGSINFADYKNLGQTLDGLTLNILFICALIGFGAKLGIFPLHVWLPRAYGLGPINVIALMASVMIKTAVYGLCRFYFDFLGNSFLWWGFFLVASGIISALYGILLAVLQNNIKRFLAYSSAENMGIILISMGLALIFKHFDQTALAALAFFTVLFHSFNHALFKGLLFICGGVIFTQLKSLELSKLRGLNKKMPYTAICFLAGVMSLASLPPFAGFVSEWLLLQNLFQLLFYLTNPVLRLLVIITLALVLLVGGLAVIGAIKNFGVAFLGKTVAEATEITEKNQWFKVSQGLLVASLLLLGLFPQYFMAVVNNLVANYFVPLSHNSLFLTIPQQAGTLKDLNLALIFGSLLLISVLVVVLVRILFNKSKVVIAETWTCGFNYEEKMQYTATSFTEPLLVIFKKILGFERKVDISKEYEYYHKKIEHSFSLKVKLLQLLYLPLVKMSLQFFKKVRIIQNGKLRDYLSYMVIALIVSLLMVW